MTASQSAPERDDPFESREFYEMCQRYRWAKEVPQDEVVRAFDALKDFCRAATRQELVTHVEIWDSDREEAVVRELMDPLYRRATPAALAAREPLSTSPASKETDR